MKARKNTPPDLSHIVEPLRPLAVPVADLNPDPANARIHPDRNLATITASLRVYGQRKPLVVRREGMVVEAGNGTLEAIKRLGWTHVAVVLVDDDPLTATGYAIADNRTSELAAWDEAALGPLLAELKAAEEVDLEALGWTDAELDRIFGAVPAFEPTSDDDQHDLDKLAPKLCPHCGRDIRQPPTLDREAS
ncbi:MAG: ParB N-terminal domain-containing protein [Planctomycetes bacterium]|nr:ParB N-terminal domain-containing protein [Planctomycetota bacterium]